MIAPDQVQRDVEAALDAHGLGPCRLWPISPLPGRNGGRLAYRAQAQDGRVVKARHLTSREEAARLCALRAGLEPAFAPILARYGAVLVEEWVDGRQLPTDEGAEARAEEAGALLGALHVTPLPADAPSRLPTASWRERAAADLGTLGAAGCLTRHQVARLGGELVRHDPGSARAALIHRDFCAENMVVDGDGRLRIIDNEWLMIGPGEFDLERTQHRWPMSEDAWARFRHGHSSVAPEPEALGFWTVVATLFGARVFLQADPRRLEPLVVALRTLAGER